MRIPATLLLLTFTVLEGAELTTEEAFQEILVRHQKIESYFAVYEGEAPGGKTVKAAISYHGPSQMASVHTQFQIDGQMVAAPLQAITPELGLVMSGQNAIHLKDASSILQQLTRVAALLFPNKEQPLGTWSPALSMTKETMAAQLTITYQPQMPWIRGRLPKGTTHAVDGEFTIFTTPEGSVSKVQSATGILQSQSFPNQDGDRTLVLKELQTNLSTAEVSTFINGFVPSNLEEMSMRSHPLLANLQHQILTEFVIEVDEGQSSYREFSKLIPSFKPLLNDYFNAIYPTDFWPRPDEEKAFSEEQMLKLREEVKTEWDFDSFQPEKLHPKTSDGEMVAKLLTTTFKDEFLAFLQDRTTLPR